MSSTSDRLVRANPPTLDDCTSQKEKGIPMARPDPEIALLWDGVSVYATEAHARNQAKAKPWLGAYIAEVLISEGVPMPPRGTVGHERGRFSESIFRADPILVRRTGTRRGHHTLRGNPIDLRALVTRVFSVWAVEHGHAKVR